METERECVCSAAKCLLVVQAKCRHGLEECAIPFANWFAKLEYFPNHISSHNRTMMLLALLPFSEHMCSKSTSNWTVMLCIYYSPLEFTIQCCVYIGTPCTIKTCCVRRQNIHTRIACERKSIAVSYIYRGTNALSVKYSSQWFLSYCSTRTIATCIANVAGDICPICYDDMHLLCSYTPWFTMLQSIGVAIYLEEDTCWNSP